MPALYPTFKPCAIHIASKFVSHCKFLDTRAVLEALLWIWGTRKQQKHFFEIILDDDMCMFKLLLNYYELIVVLVREIIPITIGLAECSSLT